MQALSVQDYKMTQQYLSGPRYPLNGKKCNSVLTHYADTVENRTIQLV